MKHSAFRSKNFYKGNLHCHSTLSDGTYTPEELKDIYKKNGYSFIAYTDHNRFNILSRLNDDSFIAYFSSEIKSYTDDEAPGCPDYRTYHINCLRKSDNKTQQEFEVLPIYNTEADYYAKTEQLLKEMNDRGYLTVINHPIWSRLKLDDLLLINGYNAIEIYNSQCGIDGSDCGEGTLYWDALLREGRRVFGVAADDNHNKEDILGDQTKIDEDSKRWPSCKGFVVVSADELSEQSIAKALEEGDFYSSTGPELYEFSIVDNVVNVRCSGCSRINIVCYERRGYSFFAEEPNGLCEVHYTLRGAEKYVRVECIDADSKTAWSNPIFLD